MSERFTHPPERYRAESAPISAVWTVWLPLALALATALAANFAPAFYDRWLQDERTGLIEFIHFLFPALVALIAITMLSAPRVRRDPLKIAWVIAMALGGIYLAGEEASWGQHWFGWGTPEGWQAVNDQQETNLHNTSHLLDQLPRAILRTGIMVTGLIVPWLLLNRPALLPPRFDFFYPPLATWPLAAMILAMEPVFQFKEAIAWSDWAKIRPGEIDELFIVFFLLIYAIVLRRRARS